MSIQTAFRICRVLQVDMTVTDTDYRVTIPFGPIVLYGHEWSAREFYRDIWATIRVTIRTKRKGS